MSPLKSETIYGLSAIDIAETLLGITEKTGHNDGVPAELFMDGDKLPWCAGFVLHCFKRAWHDSIRGSRWKLRNVKAMYKEMKRQEYFIGRNVLPKRNDIIFFNNRGDSDAGKGWHVGIVEKTDGRRIFTIEGNLSNMVKRASHAVGDTSIVGYARPSNEDKIPLI